LPKPVASISSKTRAADNTLRSLASDFGMTNINSPVRGQRAAPAPPPSNVVDFRMSGAPAWGGKYGIGPDGRPYPMCVPTGVTGRMAGKNIIDQKARYTPGKNLGAASEIVGSWAPSAADIQKARGK
jgi:hypothetical protein